MSGNTNISRVFFYLIFSITLAFSVGFVLFWIIHEGRSYKAESTKIRNNYIDLSKTKIKREVQSVIQYIEYRKSKVNAKLKQDIRDRVIEAHAAATSIYNQFKGRLPDSEIKSLVLCFLKTFSFNDGRGYFFAIDMNGVSADTTPSDHEGCDPLVSGEKALIGEMLRIAGASGEGFVEYKWPKPGSPEGQFPKIAFMKLFEHYKLLIGTGEYPDEVEANLKKEILEWLNELEQDDSYIAAFSFEGERLAFYRKAELGSNVINITDPNGVKIVQEGIRLAKEGGGFLEYVASARPSTGKPAAKISFCMGVPDWNWMILSGVYLDEVDSLVESKKALLYTKIKESLVYTLVIFVSIATVLLTILAVIFRKINAGFQAFFSFFDRAAKERTLMDPERMGFAEFRTLAQSANRMLARIRKADDDVRSSEARYRAVVEDQTELICRLLPDGGIIFVNDAYCRFFDKPRDEIIGESFLSHIHDGDLQVMLDHLASLTRKEPVGTFEHRAISGQGRTRWLQWTNRAIFDNGGKMIEYQAVGRDITEQKRVEDALFKSERRFREMLEKVKLAAVIMDTEGAIIFCNDFLLEITGWTREEVLGQNWFDVFIPEEEREDSKASYSKETPYAFQGYHESRIVTRAGERRLIAWNNTPMRNEQGTVRGQTSIGDDITERARAEAERIRLATAIQQSTEAVLISDTDWKIRYVNPAFERISGYSRDELIGVSSGLLKSNDLSFFQQLQQNLSDGEIWSGHITCTRKDGSAYEAEVTASPVKDKSGTVINYLCIHRDVTHEIKLEKDLRQAQKMEAIGTLAGGIAHDFNNILTAIIGYAELDRLSAASDTPQSTNLEQVLKAATRARDLVKQILTFSMKAEHEHKPIILAPVINEVLKLLRSSLPTTIEIRQNIESAEGAVLADPTQIHQVLMNLCTNSAHAMRSGGVLEVGLSEVDTLSSGIPGCPNLKPGRYLKLSVSDNGHGMDSETVERIFDPYFTTKKPGEGTGMGLAVVQGIVKNIDGTILVSSRQGKGTTFSIYLPRTSAAAPPVEEELESLPRGSERIIFVDDEPDLAELGKEMLEAVGYRVAAFTSSTEALDTIKNQPEDFDLLITDMTMPLLTGLELSDEIRKIRPDLPIIICTGFSDLLNGEQKRVTGVREVIMKPYAIGYLAKAIRGALDMGSQPPNSTSSPR